MTKWQNKCKVENNKRENEYYQRKKDSGGNGKMMQRERELARKMFSEILSSQNYLPPSSFQESNKESKKQIRAK